GAEIDRRRADADAEALSLSQGRRMRGGQQRLRWYATIVEAVAAHLVGLDQNRLGAQLGRAGGHAEARGSGAGDADVRGQGRHVVAVVRYFRMATKRL